MPAYYSTVTPKVKSFVDLNDTPSELIADRVIATTEDGTAIEFEDIPTSSAEIINLINSNDNNLLTGTVDPTNDIGIQNDTYINSVTATVFKKDLLVGEEYTWRELLVIETTTTGSDTASEYALDFYYSIAY